MKRSEGKVIQTQRHGWLLAKRGIKTCTCRYGDRRSEYPVGDIFDFTDDDSNDVLKIEILKVELKTLCEVTSEEASVIGNYTWVDFILEIYDIYHTKLGKDVNEKTLISLVHFRVSL